jgi:hypothetical protein
LDHPIPRFLAGVFEGRIDSIEDALLEAEDFEMGREGGGGVGVTLCGGVGGRELGRELGSVNAHKVQYEICNSMRLVE